MKTGCIIVHDRHHHHIVGGWGLLFYCKNGIKQTGRPPLAAPGTVKTETKK
jgi:hypothetical protein